MKTFGLNCRLWQKSSISVIVRNKSLITKCILGAATFTALTFGSSTSSWLATSSSLLAKEKQNAKLVSVHMFTRHGARTPIFLITGLEEAQYKPEHLEPYVRARYELRTLDNRKFENTMTTYEIRNFENTLRGKIPRGQLTSIGEQQLFEVGRRIRDKYIRQLKFLSADYRTDQIYARSTHYFRTINSAKSMLAGMYAESPNDEMKMPFIIHVHKFEDDYLFPNGLSCKYFSDMYKYIDRLELFTKNAEYKTHLAELHRELDVYHMDSLSKKCNFVTFRDDLTARKTHGLPVPKHLEELHERSHKYANMELTAATSHNLHIACGQLVNMMRLNLIHTIEADMQGKNVDYHKFRYYSAHDNTLNALLCALQLDHKNHLWPPFGADLIIELWKEEKEEAEKASQNNYFIRIVYCNEAVEMSYSDNKSNRFDCPIGNFISVLEKSSVDKETYDRLCSQPFIV